MIDSRPMLRIALAMSCVLPPTTLLADQFGPVPTYSTTVRGDFAVGQNATRVQAGSQVDNFPISLAWSGVVVRAIANWSYLTWNAGAVEEATVTINGNTVIGTVTAVTSHDCDWDYDHVASYSADITSLVAATGPGQYIIGSAIDEPSPLFSLGEGFTIVVVFDNGGPMRHVHIYLGGINSSTVSPGTGLGRMGLTPAYTGGTLNFFVNAIDGQSTLNEYFYVGSTNLSGPLTGGTEDNAFMGAEGPAGNPGDVRYDRVHGDISPYVSAGTSEIVFQSFWLQLGHDAVGHTIGAISYQANCLGDLNRDNHIEIDDLSVVLGNFGLLGAAVYEDGDLNNDRNVSIADLADMLAIFGAACD